MLRLPLLIQFLSMFYYFQNHPQSQIHLNFPFQFFLNYFLSIIYLKLFFFLKREVLYTLYLLYLLCKFLFVFLAIYKEDNPRAEYPYEETVKFRFLRKGFDCGTVEMTRKLRNKSCNGIANHD